MKWFEGGIPNAIQAAKNNKSVFIVFISGEDEASTTMESYLHSDDVTQLCEQSKCVAVRLISNSNDCKFFSQIFPVVVVPCTFFIGDNGTPLEVCGECKSSEDFLAKVKGALAQQNESSQGQGSSSPPTAATSPEEEEESQEEVGVEAGAVGGLTREGSGDDTVSPEKIARVDELDTKAKVERAKQLIEEKRVEKMRKEAEEAKAKEYERRNVGQGVQKLRQNQKETEMLEAKKEHKKDKEEDRLARQRVKEQIARDRAEKNARFSAAKEERDKAQEESRKRKLEEQAAAVSEQARRSEISRIQFRLPDGSSITQQFPATDTFAALHSFITGQMGHGISLSTSFPRRTFTEADHGTSLQELELAPSAVILVIPGRSGGMLGSTSSSGGGGALAITNILLAPLLFLWNMISSLFGFSSPASSSPSATASSSTQSPRPAAGASATGGDRSTGGARPRQPATSHQQGSIHRFHNAQDDEDDKDKATWNGNSTQQM